MQTSVGPQDDRLHYVYVRRTAADITKVNRSTVTSGVSPSLPLRCLHLHRGIHSSFTRSGDGYRAQKVREQHTTMTSRLILVLGDLFIPDRAIVNFPPINKPLNRQLTAHRTFPQRYNKPTPRPSPSSPVQIHRTYTTQAHKASTDTLTVQETPHPRKDRPNPLSRQPNLPQRLHLPTNPSPRPPTRQRRLRHPLILYSLNPIEPKHPLQPTTPRRRTHAHRSVQSRHPWHTAHRVHARPHDNPAGRSG